MMARRTNVGVWLLALVAMAVAAGCGPLVGVKATISVDQRTQLEREVLGARAEMPPEQALLLPTEQATAGRADLEALFAEYVAMEGRLAAVQHKDSFARAWEVISLHNRGVLKAWLGEKDEAAGLLESARDRAAAYWLATLEWQCAADLGFVTGDQDVLKSAADRLLSAPVLTDLDYRFESPVRRARLYAAADRQGVGGRRLGGRLPARARRGCRGAGARDGAGGAGRAGRRAARRRSGARRRAPRSGRCGARRAACWRRTRWTRRSKRPRRRWRTPARRLASLSAAGGLFVPAPADPNEVRELLTPGSALLAFAPAGGGAYAGFLLSADAFEMQRVPSDNPVAPFAPKLAGVQRLYLAVPAELSALDWQGLKFGQGTLGAAVQLTYLGGVSDLPWAFRDEELRPPVAADRRRLAPGDEPGGRRTSRPGRT